MVRIWITLLLLLVFVHCCCFSTAQQKKKKPAVVYAYIQQSTDPPAAPLPTQPVLYSKVRDFLILNMWSLFNCWLVLDNFPLSFIRKFCFKKFLYYDSIHHTCLYATLML